MSQLSLDIFDRSPFILQDGMLLRPSEIKAAQVEASGFLPPLPGTGQDTKRAQHLYQLAESLQADIERKRNCHSHANLTRKRLAEQQSAFKEADRLEKMQFLLRGLASLWSSGPSAPSFLSGVRTKAQAEELVRISRRKEDTDDYGHQTGWIWEWGDRMWPESNRRLQECGIHDPDTFTLARQWVYDFLRGVQDNDLKHQALIRRREQELVLKGIPDFFPTPPAIISMMLDAADICPKQFVLEPSAGSGSIADAIKEHCPDARLQVEELNYDLLELLKMKGYTPIEEDFLRYDPANHARNYRVWDRIVMNPPFSNSEDIAHIRHAYDCLDHGGRLVSLAASGVTFRTDRKTREFREWLTGAGGHITVLPTDAFKEGLRPTSISAVMIVVDKPNSR